MRKRLYIITGPTASGKTSKAVALAKHINGEIISADSRQIYRGMDLGTGKDLDEYDGIPYHLIDIYPAGYKYNLFEFVRDYQKCRDDIWNRGKNIIICGGTGLYIETILKGIHLPEVPENEEIRMLYAHKSLEELTTILQSYKTLHNTTDVDTVKRAIRAIEIQEYYIQNPELYKLTKPNPVNDALIIGIDIDRENRRRRISERLKARIEAGMIDEVKRLLYEEKVPPEDLIYYGLEYKFITNYVIGNSTFEEMFNGLEIAIHQFAKRQMTWFRGMRKRGFNINWLPYNLSNEDFIAKVMELDSNQ